VAVGWAEGPSVPSANLLLIVDSHNTTRLAFQRLRGDLWMMSSKPTQACEISVVRLQPCGTA
jgi:hypothetical protein